MVGNKEANLLTFTDIQREALTFLKYTEDIPPPEK